MKIPSGFLTVAASLIVVSVAARGAETMPLSPAWNVQPSGRAGSSGELLFRMTPADGDPVDVAVSVLSGSNEVQVARDIRQALAAHLQPDRFNVELGQGANVIITDRRNRPNFSFELVDSGVQDLRVAVQSVVPVAPPTVPRQATPATPPPTNAPAGPGDGRAPVGTSTSDGAPAATPSPESSSATGAPPPTNSPQTAPPESTPAPNPSANPSPPPEAGSQSATGATGASTPGVPAPTPPRR